MSVIKRISGILTPPPFRRREEPDERQQYTDGRYDFANQVRSHLRPLLVTEAVDAETVSRIANEIKQLGHEKGLYATAAEIRIQLELMVRRAIEEGTPLYADRGYRLAADFIIYQIVKEIEGIRTTGSGLGPHILASYCSDLYACLIDGHDVRRAIETPVMIAERLLWYASPNPAQRPAFLAFLDPVLTPALKLVQQKEEQLQQNERQGALTRRKRDAADSEESQQPTRRRKPEGSGAPADPWRTSKHLNVGLAFLRQIQTRCLSLREALLQFEGAGCVTHEDLGRPVESTRLAQHLEYLSGLQTIAQQKNYAAFLGAVNEETGLCLLQANAAQARHAFAAAARCYELQGDEEAAILLANLAQSRYKRAIQLYTKAQDMPAAERVASRIEKTR